MSRNLVICFDGTGNEFSSGETNVLRLFELLLHDPSQQLTYYDPGVGTLPAPGLFTKVGQWISMKWELATGADLIPKVEAAYKYLMANWVPGDQVYLFGFSRGAYMARVLAGYLHVIGLLRRGNENMIPYATRLYKAVRGEKEKYWEECERFRLAFAQPIARGDNVRRFRVHFVGVWDTVSSMGSAWNPKSYQFTHKNPSVETLRHAVSVDERRCFFRQNLAVVAGNDFEERWFAGVHGDVGGSYPREMGMDAEIDSRIWLAPFDFIVDAAVTANLILDPSRVRPTIKGPFAPSWPQTGSPWNDRQRESLTGSWWICECYPKKVWRDGRWDFTLGMGRHRIILDGAHIDRSTLMRIREYVSPSKPRNKFTAMAAKMWAVIRRKKFTVLYDPPNLSVAFLAKVRGLPANAVPNFMPYQP
jgi:hypothetical protein